MNPFHFFASLRAYYVVDGQPLFGNNSFCCWLPLPDGTFAFQFHLLKQKKSVPQQWLIDAKAALNQGVAVDRNWFNNHYGERHFNDCRASVALWLLANH